MIFKDGVSKDPKAWANKLIWQQLHDAVKPNPTALSNAYEVMGDGYIPYKPTSKNDELVFF